MYITKATEKNCCTCNYWVGTRVVEQDGFVYSLKNLEGICNGVKRMPDGAEFKRALTFPATSCTAWQHWNNLTEQMELAA